MSTMDKVKNALHMNKDHTTSTAHTTSTTHRNNGVPEGTAGPHTTRVANAADPRQVLRSHLPLQLTINICFRVDSDLDSTRTGAFGTGTAGHTAGTGVTGTNGYGTSGVTGTNGYGTSGVTGNSGYTGTGNGVTRTTTTAGPHSSNLANKVDPRVDSDLDGSRNLGAATGTTGATAYGSNTANTGYTGTGTGYTGTGTTGHTGGLTGHHTNGHTGTAGHQTGLTGHTGTTGGISHSTNAGPHDSNVANKLDPRVDSDLDGRGNRHGAATGGLMGASGSHATAGSGTAQNTAGPHNSDMANKLDPRVDADMDGSKTFGGNMTYH
ncbi:hypothetical protein EG329_007723 [Mollisiaceae sp. DMI_Dod_QoI]|nr:hypothetical protein EG329_007723 [Helotiales sp. DMI_Dod_QoI]